MMLSRATGERLLAIATPGVISELPVSVARLSRLSLIHYHGICYFKQTFSPIHWSKVPAPPSSTCSAAIESGLPLMSRLADEMTPRDPPIAPDSKLVAVRSLSETSITFENLSL